MLLSDSNFFAHGAGIKVVSLCMLIVIIGAAYDASVKAHGRVVGMATLIKPDNIPPFRP